MGCDYIKLKDSFRLSLNNIIHRKLRAWLTLLGIIIGVAAVVSIISIGEGAQASVTENLGGFGADVLTISPGGGGTSGFGGRFRGGPPGSGGFGGSSPSLSTETPELGNLDVIIIKGNPNVQYVNEIVSGRGEFVFLSEQVTANILGVNPNTWTETINIELASGRLLSISDSAAVVIGGDLANETFKQPITVGRRVSIEDQPFTVVGILEEGSSAYIPFRTAWDVVDVNKNTYSSIQAKVADTEIMEQTTDEITAALQLSRKVTERDQDFSISSPLQLQQQVGEILGTLTLFLGAIAAVSLLVGAVGIANSMFTSVLEKTREIGIMKALGSTDSEILQLFVIESGLFGLIGGIIGVTLGVLIAYMLSIFISLTTLVSPTLMITAIILSSVIGIISGLIPARAASKLKPVDALRYE